MIRRAPDRVVAERDQVAVALEQDIAMSGPVGIAPAPSEHAFRLPKNEV
jgi:hypothetical protein